MNKLGKEAKVLLYGITITCVISFLLAFGISSLMAKEYQKDLMQHDYFMAGYLLNHSDALELSAFTAEQNENDIETGRNALEAIGYDDSIAGAKPARHPPGKVQPLLNHGRGSGIPGRCGIDFLDDRVCVLFYVVDHVI